MSHVAVEQIGAEQLPRYAAIPIAFWVDSVFRVQPVDGGVGGLRLALEPVSPPYLKDYDAQCGGRERPVDWPRLFDIRHWGLFLAAREGRAVGGAAIAVNSPGLHMLENRADLAVLWDIRVHPDDRAQGIGTTLFRHAVAWARAQGCRLLKVETQNVNVRACRFYARQGCELGAIHRYEYTGCPEVAHETMLLWYLDVARADPDPQASPATITAERP